MTISAMRPAPNSPTEMVRLAEWIAPERWEGARGAPDAPPVPPTGMPHCRIYGYA